MHQINNITLFFGADDALSNWHRAGFEYRGVRFNCVEQFMMYSKAMLFEDRTTAKSILAAPDPRSQKKLGREVQGFDERVWAAKREAIVTVGCREKFRQNSELADTLLATGDTVLVEASPYDCIWGVGLAWNDPLILDPQNWRGRNLLGQALTTVRSLLRQERSSNSVRSATMPVHHKLYTPADVKNQPEGSTLRRLVEDGGLAICMVCGLGEGTLTTHCPGERSGKYGDDVYAGKVDFVGDRWIAKPNPTNQTWARVNVEHVVSPRVSATGSTTAAGLHREPTP
ncbi:hypothetical protein CRM94_17335 [Burkholderia gladioli]|uniref:NADAR domain-containing protein n=1 Tax=Burkholderia gladioli TaxID=28095 RepID=A0A2A7SA87_BURGA|nr:NADAR family protein [Burkholderia gladioli]PEH40476.1 hypothetical protein CRM94_17335 [Burkholderia gladioli]